jgi:hypothetical protein
MVQKLLVRDRHAANLELLGLVPNGITFIPSFMKISQLIKKLLMGNTHEPYLLLSTESTLNMTSMPGRTVRLVLPEKHFTVCEACLAISRENGQQLGSVTLRKFSVTLQLTVSQSWL